METFLILSWTVIVVMTTFYLIKKIDGNN